MDLVGEVGKEASGRINAGAEHTDLPVRAESLWKVRPFPSGPLLPPCPGKEGPSSPGITERSLLRSAQAYSLWRVPWEQGGFEHVLGGQDRAFSEDAGNSLSYEIGLLSQRVELSIWQVMDLNQWWKKDLRLLGRGHFP